MTAVHPVRSILLFLAVAAALALALSSLRRIGAARADAPYPITETEGATR